MIELGKIQKLVVVKIASVGAYLGSKNAKGEEPILLPKKQAEGLKIGDEVEVFVYRDSSDRMICTTNVPKIVMGECKLLRVVDVNQIGAFLNWGLEKDLFLPFKEQTERLHKNSLAFVSLYIDKSQRLCATMKVNNFLRTDSPYKAEDMVTGIIYAIKHDVGAFVAVDGKYMGMIPSYELHDYHKYGDEVSARVVKVKEDGKLDLSLRAKSYLQMDADAEKIYARLIKAGGFLPFNDDTTPSKIKAEFNMSKNAFKRALGRLLKEKKICFVKDGIHKL